MHPHIQTLRAMQFVKVMENGRTKPWVVHCGTLKNGDAGEYVVDAGEYVVKAKGMPEITDKTLLFEVTGNLLARRLGINTPEPALVEITDPFLASVRSSSSFQATTAGIGVGCEYLTAGFNTSPKFGDLDECLLKQAASIYTFDMLVQNDDRRRVPPGNINYGVHNEKLVAFDFELCFGFCVAVGAKLLPGKMPPGYEKHVFHSILRQHILTRMFLLDDIFSKLNSLTDEDLAQILQLGEIFVGSTIYCDRIKEHILNLCDHLEEFREGLMESLR